MMTRMVVIEMEFLIVPFDSPASLCVGNKLGNRRVCRLQRSRAESSSGSTLRVDLSAPIRSCYRTSRLRA